MRSPWKATLRGVRFDGAKIKLACLPVHEVIVDFGRGKVWVVYHNWDVYMLAGKFRQSPLLIVRCVGELELFM